MLKLTRNACAVPCMKAIEQDSNKEPLPLRQKKDHGGAEVERLEVKENIKSTNKQKMNNVLNIMDKNIAFTNIIEVLHFLNYFV